jgi:hypothetical protein
VVNCFKPASKYNLIKMGNIFFRMCQSPGYGSTQFKAVPYKKDTVLKVLNILYEKFQVGVICDQVVVVGDGKSYDIVIKLKAEYGTA